MSYGLTDSQYYSAIADAIRDKLDVETTYTPAQMAQAIESITGGTPGVLTGNNAPDNSLGENGDIYLQFDVTPKGIACDGDSYLNFPMTRSNLNNSGWECTFALINEPVNTTIIFGNHCQGSSTGKYMNGLSVFFQDSKLIVQIPRLSDSSSSHTYVQRLDTGYDYDDFYYNFHTIKIPPILPSTNEQVDITIDGTSVGQIYRNGLSNSAVLDPGFIFYGYMWNSTLVISDPGIIIKNIKHIIRDTIETSKEVILKNLIPLDETNTFYDTVDDIIYSGSGTGNLVSFNEDFLSIKYQWYKSNGTWKMFEEYIRVLTSLT